MNEKALGSYASLPIFVSVPLYMTNVGSLPTWPQIFLPCFAHALLVFYPCEMVQLQAQKRKESGKWNMQTVIYMEESFSLPN